jgi:CubicO group peptidase (beta-lactamase class C family)
MRKHPKRIVPVRTAEIASLLDPLGSMIEAAAATFEVPGCAVAIIDRETPVFCRTFGVKDIRSGEPIDEQTLFQIGSVTKPFTADVMAALVDDGLLRWDDAVVRHLPDFQLSDQGLTASVTVRDTLIHSSGYVDKLENLAHSLEVIDAKTTMHRMRLPKTFAPFRASFNYSNQMYGVAGQVVEAVTGSSWGKTVQERLFAPLGMTRSGSSAYDFWPPQHVAPVIFGSAASGPGNSSLALDRNLAMPHFPRDGRIQPIAWQSYDNCAAAGSIVSCLHDLISWVSMHLTEGRCGGRPVLSKESVEVLHAPQNAFATLVGPFASEATAYAMGWWRSKYLGETYLEHPGQILGFPSFVCLLPDPGIGIIVLANVQRENMHQRIAGIDTKAFHRAIAYWALDRVLGVPERRWFETLAAERESRFRVYERARSALRAQRSQSNSSARPSQKYVGTYVQESAGSDLTVAEVDARLILKYPGPGAFSAELENWGPDKFILQPHGPPYLDLFATFLLGSDGNPRALRLEDPEGRAIGSDCIRRAT